MVKLWCRADEGALDVRVMIPTGVVERKHAASGFDKTACEQETLIGSVATVLVTQLGGFSGEIEGFASFVGDDELVGSVI